MIVSGRGLATSFLLCANFAVAIPAHAQQCEPGTKANAPLVVDGTVREIFRGASPGKSDGLVQIEVSRCEARKSVVDLGRSRIPGPGESVYVHVAKPVDQAGRTLFTENRTGLPAEGTQIRAYLTPRQQGGWESASADWFETGSSDPADADDSPPESEIASLGMTTELMRVDGRMGLRVTSVTRGGPAQGTGLEVGDVIAAADGAEIKSANQLAELAAKGKKISLNVLDVNTGRKVQVEIEPQSKPAGDTTTGTPPPQQPARVSLGLSAEPVALGTRSALKVIRVDPQGPSAKAGLEPGDIVVAANGAPTTGVEQLLSALRKSGPTLKLTVRDSRTGRDVDIDVNLGGAGPAVPPAPAETDTKITHTSGKLGAVTELAFHNSDFAVKVSEVEPGSAAARAGLRPGVLIVAADGKPVLHPNDLNDAVRNSNGKLTLSVIEPASGKKSNVELNLR